MRKVYLPHGSSGQQQYMEKRENPKKGNTQLNIEWSETSFDVQCRSKLAADPSFIPDISIHAPDTSSPQPLSPSPGNTSFLKIDTDRRDTAA